MTAEPCLKTNGLGRKTGDINTRLNMEAAFQGDVQAHMCEHDTNRSELRRISGTDMSLCSQLRPLRVSSPWSCSANNFFCAEFHSVKDVVTFFKVELQIADFSLRQSMVSMHLCGEVEVWLGALCRA